MDKDNPDHMIPEHLRGIHVEALGNEWLNWLQLRAAKVIDVEISFAMKEEYPESRVLASRVRYCDNGATKAVKETYAKARLRARGDREPDSLAPRRDASTLARLGFYLLCSTPQSCLHLVMGHDIRGAFMQGLQELAEKEMLLFLRQPGEETWREATCAGQSSLLGLRLYRSLRAAGDDRERAHGRRESWIQPTVREGDEGDQSTKGRFGVQRVSGQRENDLLRQGGESQRRGDLRDSGGVLRQRCDPADTRVKVGDAGHGAHGGGDHGRA